MSHTITRISKQAPPAWRMFGRASRRGRPWWIQVEGELKPTVTKTQGRMRSHGRPPFVRWPREQRSRSGVTHSNLAAGLRLLHEGVAHPHPMEHAALKASMGTASRPGSGRGLSITATPLILIGSPHTELILKTCLFQIEFVIEQQWRASKSIFGAALCTTPITGSRFNAEHILPVGSCRLGSW